MGTDFRLLGPVQLWTDGRRLELGPGKQRTVLAALLVDVGRPVSTERLIDRVWDDAPPSSSRSSLYSYVTRLRKVLDQCGGEDGRPRITYGPGGYLLDADPDTVDLHRFRSTSAQARRGNRGDEERAALLDEAVGLWRGRPMADLSGGWVSKIRDALAPQRLDATLLWATVQLRLGRGERVIDVLRELLDEHPLVEPLAAKLMEALHAEERTAEALECFTGIRRRLVDELGIEPGAQLRTIHAALLRAPPVRSAPAPPVQPAPAQLPYGGYGFAGRHVELARLDELGTEPTAVVVLSGTPGVGKTALAVHWARRSAGHFPDGQLYLNLRGFAPDGPPVDPGDALSELLEGLCVPPQRIPAGLPARAALFRSVVAGKRLLVLLDNAATADQVRPLLPGSSRCLVLVTSRRQLTGLVSAEGAQPLRLDVLSTDEAQQLLGNRLGAARVHGEPAAAAEIVERCARLPLSLSLVAARAATNPRFSLTALAGELRSGVGDLDTFGGDGEGTDVRGVLSWSYAALDQGAARLFRLLGLHPGPDLAVPAAASLLGEPAGAGRAALAELSQANLMTERAPRRFAFHDLLRAYACELVERDESAVDRRAATLRLLDHYLHATHAAARHVNPHRTPIPIAAVAAGVTCVEPADYDAALAWLTAERPVLVAAVERAASAGFHRHAWQLAWALTDFLDMRGHRADLSAVMTVALRAARELDDLVGQAFAHRILGRLDTQLGRHAAARMQLARAVELYHRAGDLQGESLSCLDIGWTHTQERALGAALDHAVRALELARDLGDRTVQARALNAVGWCSAEVGEHRRALVTCTEARDLLAALGDRHGEAATWDSVGYAHHCLGEYDEALAAYETAVRRYRDLGDLFNEGFTLAHQGDSYAAASDRPAAERNWRRALVILDQLGHPEAERVRGRLAAG